MKNATSCGVGDKLFITQLFLTANLVAKLQNNNDYHFTTNLNFALLID